MSAGVTNTTTKLCTLAILLLLVAAPNPGVSATNPPNIVLILVDDLGWADIGCYGNDFVDTPRIDRLAQEGVRFTDFYAAGAVCSPTRCAIQSGQNPARIGITAHIPGHWRPFERVITPQTALALPLDIVTVGESLKRAGYRTGYVGKWHLGGSPMFTPDRQGYDVAVEIHDPHLPGRYRVGGRQSDFQPKPDQFRTDFETEVSRQFIRDHQDQPFFLMLSPYAVHIPLASKSGLVAKYRARAKELNRDLPHPVYAAMIEEIDTMVGRIVDEIDAQGLKERTMILFTSDNGGLYRRYDYRTEVDDNVSTQAPLKGEKGSLHEGGIRVPLIVRYPGIIPPGTTCSEPAISYDFYPTFVAAAGGTLPRDQTIDGLNLLPLLSNPNAQSPREALYWHYPHYHHDRPAGAIREGPWKLIEYLDGTGDLGLYLLPEDPGEANNLASASPDKAADLKAKLHRWRREVIARMPLPNPSYNPQRAHEWWDRKQGGPIDSDNRQPFPETEKE